MLNASRFSRGGGDQKTPFLVGKERELFESKKWPSSFSKPVDITKIRIDAFKPWITKRTAELMGVDDEIVVDYCISQLKVLGETDAKANAENAGDGGTVFNEKPSLDPKRLQINLTGFMAKKAHVFVKELWDLLLSAQENEYGIPQAFIDEKKREIEHEANAEFSSIKEDTETHFGDEEHTGSYTKREPPHTDERRYKTERRRSSTPVRRGSHYSRKDRKYNDRHRTHRYKRSHSRSVRRRSSNRSSSSSQTSKSSYEYRDRRHRRYHARRESRRDRSSSSDYYRRSRRSRSRRRDRHSPDDRHRRRRHSRYDSDSSSPSLAPERLRGTTRNRS